MTQKYFHVIIILIFSVCGWGWGWCSKVVLEKIRCSKRRREENGGSYSCWILSWSRPPKSTITTATVTATVSRMLQQIYNYLMCPDWRQNPTKSASSPSIQCHYKYKEMGWVLTTVTSIQPKTLSLSLLAAQSSKALKYQEELVQPLDLFSGDKLLKDKWLHHKETKVISQPSC